MKLILQRFGVGDIIFSMSAIRSFKDKVIWPVLSHYVDGLNKAYPDVFFIDSNLINIDFNKKDRYNVVDLSVIPLAHQDIPLIDCMKNKYSYFNLDWKDWKKDAAYKRDKIKEKELFTQLGLVKGEKYNLISDTFQCDFKGKKRIQLQNGLKNVYLTSTADYSLFDWSYVIENASNIHAVSSSCIYLFELLDLKAEEVKLYLREPREKDHSNYDYILAKKYILE